VARQIAVLMVRPYTTRELPGWGKLYSAIGDHRRGWLWAGAPKRIAREKLTGRVMQLDISKWSDRSAYFLGRWYDLAPQLVLADVLAPGETVIDIGANRGMFALVAAHYVGDNGKVICFEPNPDCIRIINQEVAENAIGNVLVHNFGLGDRDEELPLSVPSVNSGEGTFGKSRYDPATNRIFLARIKRGDDVLSGEKPAFIKVDVEGFECKAIRGLSETIKRHTPILMTELLPEHLAACGSSLSEFVRIVEGLGYRGFALALQKKRNRYTWTLSRFEAQPWVKDVLWLHSAAMARLEPMLRHHLTS
jgi:FkbM family methyltransferase